MSRKSTAIVAFFARGREIGFVTMEEGELVRYGVKTVRGKRRGPAFTRSVEQALSSVLRTAPDALVVVEDTPKASRLGGLSQAMASVWRSWERSGIGLYATSLAEAKRCLCGNPTATHRELAEALADRYAQLRGLTDDVGPEEAAYWEKVLLAGALAETARVPYDDRKAVRAALCRKPTMTAQSGSS